jgi:glycosyltransferase involved in cell wall biosynthesis
MSKGTIIYIGAFELPDKNAAAHRVIANGKALRDLGYDVVFIGATKSESDNLIAQKEIFFGFDCYRRKKASSTWEWLKFLTDTQFYEEIVNKYNNVHAIIGYNLPALILLNLKKFARKNNYRIYADSTEWYEIKKKGNNLLKFLIRYFDVYLRMRIINPKLDGVIAISDYLYNYYSKRTKTIQIPPLVDTRDRKWKNEFHLLNRRVKILYAGSPFSLYKEPSYKDRIDLIIEALYEIKKSNILFEMLIFGIEKEQVEENFPELKSMLSFLEDSLVFYGKRTHLEVIDTLKTVDFSLYLRYNSKSIKAGFPTKFVESISCGIPVLTNSNSNVYDYLAEGINGYWIDLSTKERIYLSLKKGLSVNNEKIFEMKKTCYSSKTFDYRNYLEQFKNFIET